MLYKNVCIDSFGYEIPPVKVSSAELEARLAPVYERLKLPEGRLEMMTGIRNRYFWNEGFLPSQGAAVAGRKAIERASVAKDDIGCLIMCSVCRDCLEPATASIVHDTLGLPGDCLVFDISNACLGVLTGMVVAAGMIELGQIRSALLVAGENSRPLVESTIKAMLEDHTLTRRTIKPCFASLTIGSGAVAAVISRKDTHIHRPSLVAASSLADTQHNNLCRGNADRGMSDNQNTLMTTDAEELMKRGVDTAVATWEIFKRESGWDNTTPDCVCTHQVGVAHRRLVFDTLGLDMAKDFPTLQDFGNTGSVSCPMTVALAAECGRLKQGDRLAVLGIGSGINCTAMGVEW